MSADEWDEIAYAVRPMLASLSVTSDEVVWESLSGAGIHQLLVNGEAGGGGGNLAHLAALNRELGRIGMTAGVAEAALCNCFLDRVRAPLLDEPVSIAVAARRCAEPSAVTSAGSALLTFPEPGGRALLLSSDSAPDRTVDISDADSERCHRLLAMSVSGWILGGTERLLELTVQYAEQREQFGSPIGAYQAVAHHLAVMAGEVACLASIFERAVESEMESVATNNATTSDDMASLAAAARVEAARVAVEVTRLAHQVHGAIGITGEAPSSKIAAAVATWAYAGWQAVQWDLELGAWAVAHGSTAMWMEMTR